MKKFLKVFFITLGSLILLVLIVAGIASWLVFTPARLTPIVEKQAGKYLDCKVVIDKVDLSLVKIFPEAQLVFEGLTLINPMAGAPCDTLLDVRSAVCRVDVMALWKRQELVLRDFTLLGGSACVFVDGEGRANYDIFPALPKPVDETEEGGFSIGYMDFGNVTLHDVAVRYADRQAGMDASIAGADVQVKGEMRGEDIKGRATVKLQGVEFATDSLGGSLCNLSLDLDGSMVADDIKANVSATMSGLTASVGGAEMVSGADVILITDAIVRQKPVAADIKSLFLSLNGMEITANGSVGLPEEGGIAADITYRFASWPLQKIVSLVPQEYSSYLNGVDVAGGTISSEGMVRGIYNKDSMPLLDLSVVLDGVRGEYAEFPLPLRNLDADVKVYTDLSNDRISYVTVNSLKAATTKSEVALDGRLTNLFSDIRAQLSGRAQLDAGEFMPFIPDSLDVSASGMVGLDFKADGRMSQLENMELDKIKASGKLMLAGFEAAYDTLSMATDRMEVAFSLPNAAPKDKSRGFLAADITAGLLDVKMGEGIAARLESPHISAEMADLRDTTRIQPVALSARFAYIDASVDTISLSVAAPSLDFSMAAQRRDEAQPRFSLTYGSDRLSASMGDDHAATGRIDLKASVAYNKAEENPLLRFRPRGKLDAEGISADIAVLGNKIEVPVMSLGLTPRELDIDDINILYAGSDFRLSGRLDNLMAYALGREALTGEFLFASEKIDLIPFMDMADFVETDESKSEATITGPFMVPDRMDVTLHTSIKKVFFFDEVISDIEGDIYIRNGNLVLDELTLDLPGAGVQVTAIYNTPRRNHLFAGVDFHLLDVEIATLLQMIPDLDSMMPMLRSFSGKGEFHFAGQTNLDSLYNMKLSTLRGSASIRGEDLILLDGETFHTIARKLWFRNKDSEYQIDSMSAEFTIFRNEIDVYPFLVSIDRYAAVVGGRHNTDMTFDYNISLVESPLPFRLAVGVTGNLDELKFKLARSRYPKFYRPVARHEVKSKQTELREMIRQALASYVVDKKEDEE